jgi:hypothetical protein
MQYGRKDRQSRFAWRRGVAAGVVPDVLGDDGLRVAGTDPGDLIEAFHQPRRGPPSLAQPGACPPPIIPQVPHAGATPGMEASCCSIAASQAGDQCGQELADQDPVTSLS